MGLKTMPSHDERDETEDSDNVRIWPTGRWTLHVAGETRSEHSGTDIATIEAATLKEQRHEFSKAQSQTESVNPKANKN